MKDAPYISYYKSPLGWIEITASPIGITSVLFVSNKSQKMLGSDLIDDCIVQLKEYFSKKRKSFTVSMDPQGTPFQIKVWKELLNIQFGKTVSYLDLAIALGDKNAIRAVGGANGKNPVSIIVPCHRVIGTNGDLVGYSGGMDKKKWLLGHEGVLRQKELFT